MSEQNESQTLRSLTALYRQLQKPDQLNDLISDTDILEISAPLLIYPFADYFATKNKKKVMYVGQETCTWGDQTITNIEDFFLNENSIERLLECYREFDFAESEDRGSKHSPFWKFHREICFMIGGTYRSVVWTNLMRCDVAASSPIDTKSEPLLCKFQQGILRAEIDIFKPDIVLLVTGPRYDEKIQHELGEFKAVSVSDLDSSQLAEIRLNVSPFTKCSPLIIRTYHPAYLNSYVEKLRVPTMNYIANMLE
jgi:hypothetical protein